jgi:O-antigen/teichoic acid export membrane protein
MKLDFAQHARRNAVAGILNSGVKLVFPFLNRTLFLWLLGPEFLGLNGLFTSVLGVLSLAELGFGTAVVCSMYKPVADGDKDLIRAYLRFYRGVYRAVGTVIFCAGLCLLPFLGHLVRGGMPPGVHLHVLYLLHLANTAMGYFLFAYRGSALAAYARRDVLSHIASVVQVGQYLTVFAVLVLTREAGHWPAAASYYAYVGTTLVFTALNNLLLWKESRRLFPDLEPRGELERERRRSVLADVRDIFLHKVGGVVSYQSDNLVISASLGLVAVAAYGNYYYVVAAVSGVVGALSAAMLGGFGNKIHTESLETTFRLFLKANRVLMIATLWCAAVMTGVYQPFIEVWTRQDPTLVRHALTPMLMVLYFFTNQSRQMLLTVKSAASLWKGDRWKPIVAGAVNLGISIGLVVWLPKGWKLDGVIFGTIASLALIQVPWEAHVLFTGLFTKEQKQRYWMEQFSFTGLAVWLCFGAWLSSFAVMVDGVFGLVCKAVTSACTATLVLLLLFRNDFLEMLRILRRR